eukprot:31197-Pelagococcus_subviridis.AAC.9
MSSKSIPLSSLTRQNGIVDSSSLCPRKTLASAFRNPASFVENALVYAKSKTCPVFFTGFVCCWSSLWNLGMNSNSMNICLTRWSWNNALPSSSWPMDTTTLSRAPAASAARPPPATEVCSFHPGASTESSYLRLPGFPPVPSRASDVLAGDDGVTLPIAPRSSSMSNSPLVPTYGADTAAAPRAGGGSSYFDVVEGSCDGSFHDTLTYTVPLFSRVCENSGYAPCTGRPFANGPRSTRAMPMTPAPSKSMSASSLQSSFEVRRAHERELVNVVEVRVGASAVDGVVPGEAGEGVAAVRHHRAGLSRARHQFSAARQLDLHERRRRPRGRVPRGGERGRDRIARVDDLRQSRAHGVLLQRGVDALAHERGVPQTRYDLPGPPDDVAEVHRRLLRVVPCARVVEDALQVHARHPERREVHPEALEERVRLDDVLQRVVHGHVQAVLHRRRLRLVLEEIHRHERRRVRLVHGVLLDVHAEEAEFEDVLPEREVVHVLFVRLGDVLEPVHARAHRLRRRLVRDGTAGEDASELRLELVNLLLPALEFRLVRLHAPVQILVEFVRARLLFRERDAQVRDLRLLQSKHLLRLVHLLDLVRVRLAQSAELRAQGTFVELVVRDDDRGALRRVHEPVRVPHLHEDANLILRVFETAAAEGRERPLQVRLAQLRSRALALRLDHERAKPARFGLRLRRRVHRRREQGVVLLLEREAFFPRLFEHRFNLSRRLELHREPLFLRGELQVLLALRVQTLVRVVELLKHPRVVRLHRPERGLRLVVPLLEHARAFPRGFDLPVELARGVRRLVPFAAARERVLRHVRLSLSLERRLELVAQRLAVPELLSEVRNLGRGFAQVRELRGIAAAAAVRPGGHHRDRVGRPRRRRDALDLGHPENLEQFRERDAPDVLRVRGAQVVHELAKVRRRQRRHERPEHRQRLVVGDVPGPSLVVLPERDGEVHAADREFLLDRLEDGRHLGLVRGGVLRLRDRFFDAVAKLREGHFAVAVQVEEHAEVLHVPRGRVRKDRAKDVRHLRAVQRPLLVAVERVEHVLEPLLLRLEIPVEALNEPVLLRALERDESPALHPPRELRELTRRVRVHAHRVPVDEVAVPVQERLFEVPLVRGALTRLRHALARRDAIRGDDVDVEHPERVRHVLVRDASSVIEVELAEERDHVPTRLRGRVRGEPLHQVEQPRVRQRAAAEPGADVPLVASDDVLELLQRALDVHVRAFRGRLARADDVFDARDELGVRDAPVRVGVHERPEKVHVRARRADDEFL